MSGDFVTTGQPFDPPARVWNDFVRTRDTVAAGRVIFGVPPETVLPKSRLKLFVALQEFSGFGICAELRYDPNVYATDYRLTGSPWETRWQRIDGVTTTVFNPLIRANGSVCGPSVIRCGMRFWAEFNAVSGHYEIVTGPDTVDLILCPCVKYGYALWTIIDGYAGPEWSLVENRCSGCYDPFETGRQFIFPEQRFTNIGINDDTLQPPTVDPSTITLEEGQYFVTCCMPDGDVPAPPACQCCYVTTFNGEISSSGVGTKAISGTKKLYSTATAVPCAFVYPFTLDSQPVGVSIQATGSNLFVYIDLGYVIVVLTYVGAGGDMDCDDGRNYTFDSGIAYLDDGNGLTALTSEADTVNIGGADYTYAFDATVPLDLDADCNGIAGGGGGVGGTCAEYGVWVGGTAGTMDWTQTEENCINTDCSGTCSSPAPNRAVAYDGEVVNTDCECG